MKTTACLLFTAILLTSCSDQQLRQEADKLIAENEALKAELQKQKKELNRPPIKFVQLVKLKSQLPDSAVIATMRQRKPQFVEVPGLVQKFYLQDTATAAYGGLYLWESEQHYLDYRRGELAKSIPEAYQTKGKPEVEVFRLLFPLREQ
jgi:hypothetical protein